MTWLTVFGASIVAGGLAGLYVSYIVVNSRRSMRLISRSKRLAELRALVLFGEERVMGADNIILQPANESVSADIVRGFKYNGMVEGVREWLWTWGYLLLPEECAELWKYIDWHNWDNADIEDAWLLRKNLQLQKYDYEFDVLEKERAALIFKRLKSMEWLRWPAGLEEG